MTSNYWLEELLSNPRDFIDQFYKQGKYYQKIRTWDKNNKKRKNPRAYYVFTLDKDDAKRNATFSTYEFGIKEHMIGRGYVAKIASLLPMSNIKKTLLKIAGVQMEENIFIAPEVIIDPVLRGWTRLRKGASLGWGTRCFNHLFEENGRIVVGYVDIGEDSSVGGFVTICPGVIINKKANIGATVTIGPGVTIGERAKIGAGAFIAPFISIGEGAEVAMGSVVAESVPAYTKVAGNPAQIVINKTKDKKPKLDLIVNPNLEKTDQAEM